MQLLVAAALSLVAMVRGRCMNLEVLEGQGKGIYRTKQLLCSTLGVLAHFMVHWVLRGCIVKGIGHGAFDGCSAHQTARQSLGMLCTYHTSILPACLDEP